jgi:hypothetical protein
MNHIIESYSRTRSMYDTAKELDLSPHYVWRILKKCNIELRNVTDTKNKIDIDESYFENINSPDKAYFLGLIYSDGNIYDNTCRVSLVEDDAYILENISKILSPKRKLHYKKSRLMPNGNMAKPQKSLSFTNKKMIEDLEVLGVFPNKSLHLNFPSSEIIPDNLMSHFIRGYFDGDGSISNRKTRYKCGFVGSDSFCGGLMSYLSNIGINCCLYKDSKVSRVITSNKTSILKLYQWMYDDSENFKLLRKYNKFIDMINSTNWEKIDNIPYSSTKGVTFDKRRKKWYANKKINGKNHWIGSFELEEDARRAIENFIFKLLDN